MKIEPLYKLFTTKEDRLAVYKAFQLGMHPSKVEQICHYSNKGIGAIVKDLEKYKCTEILSPAKSAKSVDKSAELAKKSGVDLLTIKQFIFCDLMANSTDALPADAQPFACTTVEEIDALGKRIFGRLWESENLENTQTYSVEYRNDELSALLKGVKLVPITAPFVYPEMFGKLTDFSGYGVCTLIACFNTAFQLRRELKCSILKDYLNNTPDRVVDKFLESELEQLFFANLFDFRSRFIRDSHADEFGAPKADLRTISKRSTEEFFVLRRGSGLLGHVLVNMTPELWDAYNTLIYNCTSVFIPPFCADDDELREFIIKEVWFRYLLGEWAHLVTSVPMSGEEYGRTARLVIAVDMDEYNKTNNDGKLVVPDTRALPVDAVQDSPRYVYAIKTLPQALDRVRDKGVISYTVELLSLLWDENASSSPDERDEKGKFKEFKQKPKMLITNSCYISVLRRAGAELYFAFRDNNAEGESLTIYVDNAEDKTFVEDCAKSVGVTLNTGKNFLILSPLVQREIPSFAELNTQLDSFDASVLAEELMRYTLLSFMILGGENYEYDPPEYYKPGDSDDAFIDDLSVVAINTYIEQRAVFTYTRPKDNNTSCNALFIKERVVGGTCERHLMDLTPLIAFSNLSHGGKITFFDLDNATLKTDTIANCITDKSHGVLFVKAQAITMEVKDKLGNVDTVSGRLQVLPLLVDKGFCEYIRWEELPKILPDFAEAWSQVDTISRRNIRRYLLAENGRMEKTD